MKTKIDIKNIGKLSTFFTIFGVVTSGIGTILGHFNQKIEVAKKIEEEVTKIVGDIEK